MSAPALRALRYLGYSLLLIVFLAFLTAVGILPPGLGFMFFVATMAWMVIGFPALEWARRRRSNRSPTSRVTPLILRADVVANGDAAWRLALLLRREHWRRLRVMSDQLDALRAGEVSAVLRDGVGWFRWQSSYREAAVAHDVALRTFQERYDVDFPESTEEPGRDELLHVDRVFQAHTTCRFGHWGAHHLIAEGWSGHGRPRVLRECTQCTPSTLWLEWSTGE